MSAHLELAGVTVQRHGLTVCRNVSLRAREGEITVLLGANGAGKTTLLDMITGRLPAHAGRITWHGQRIDRLPVHRRAARGIAYIDQARSVFSRLTVAENIAVVDPSPAALAHAFDLFPQLAARRDTRAALLSGGEQQMLLIARALAHRPRMLLIDELSFGLAPNLVHELMRTVADLARQGIGVVLVEQYAELALRIGTTGHIMQRGRIVRSGPCSELIRDENAIAASYLAGPDPDAGS